MEMTFDTIVFAAIFAVLWRLHRDVEALRRTMLGGADSLRGNMEALRRDLRGNMEALRRDLRGNKEALRRDLRGNIEALRRDVGEIGARLAKVEGMLMGASLRARLDA